MHLKKYSIDCQSLIDGYRLSEEQLRDLSKVLKKMWRPI